MISDFSLSFRISVLLSSKLTLFPRSLPLHDSKTATLISSILKSYTSSRNERNSLSRRFCKTPGLALAGSHHPNGQALGHEVVGGWELKVGWV